MAVEEDVLWRVRDLRALVVVVDENLFWCFVCEGNVGSEQWPVHDYADDLVGSAEVECVRELAEFFGVVDRQTPEEQGTVRGEPSGQDAILRLESFDSLNSGVKIYIVVVVSGRSKHQWCYGVAWMQWTKKALVAVWQLERFKLRVMRVNRGHS